jgi:hypothetical protein
VGSITGLGTGIATALAINTGNSGAPVLIDGALGTPTSGVGTNLTALNATQLTSGTVPDARFPATLPAASGVNLTALNASNLGSGTVPAARFPALTGEATTTAGAVAVTLSNSAVIGKVLTGYTSGAGTVAATDSILGAIQKLNGNAANLQPLDAELTAISGLAANGLIARTSASTAAARTLTGTAAEITVTNGDGVSGNPTLSLPAALIFTGKTVTGGTFSSPTLTTPALGTPASGVVTNLTGTAAININGTVGATTPSTGVFTGLTVNDNSTLGSSNTDTVTFSARVASDLNPATDNTYDLGVTGHEWRNLNIDGTANIDSLVADSADINGGTIDGTAIGATTPSTGAFTTLSSTGITSVAGGQYFSAGSSGTGAPTFTTRSAGTKVVLYDQIGAASLPFSLGVDSGTLWLAAGGASDTIKSYVGTSLISTLSLTGLAVTSSGTSALVLNSVGSAADTALRINRGSGTYWLVAHDAVGGLSFNRDGVDKAFFGRNGVDGLTVTGNITGTGVYSTTTGSAANVFVDSAGLLQRSTSSLRYKIDLKPYQRGLADAAKLNLFTYRAKDKPDSTERFAGVGAEEMHALGFTEFVEYRCAQALFENLGHHDSGGDLLNHRLRLRIDPLEVQKGEFTDGGLAHRSGFCFGW